MKIGNKRKAVVTSFLISIFAVSLFAFSGTLPVSAVEPPTTMSWYQKPPAIDYAQSGVPDFDQKQDNWNSTDTVKYSLWAHAVKGWGTSPMWQTIPGPTLFAAQGETVTLTLTSADGNAHSFWIDLNGNGLQEPAEVSPAFGGVNPLTIVWSFTVNTPVPGPLPYSCTFHPANIGTLFVSAKRWTWCGPTAVADSLWWWDSHIDGGTNPPPAVEDHFPLVQNYGPWDDHDPKNVVPFVEDLASLMNTDVGTTGTNVFDMQAGVRLYLEEKGLNMSFYERTWWDCNLTFENLYKELYKCEDVILLLGFYQEIDPYEGTYVRVGGHYVTLAGMGNDTATGDQWVKLSDPFIDYAELMGWNYSPYVPIDHAAGHDSTVHNNASLVSHDPYKIASTPTFLYGVNPDLGHFMIEDYPWDTLLHEGGLAAQGGEVDSGPIAEMPMYAVVEYAVVFSPTQYDKPSYPEYAPSGVPDFDQHQDLWQNPITMKWSYCGPVALANSLWYFDSKFDNGTEPDGFPLVQNYGPWDDHDPQNVVPLINELAWLADTDGWRTGIIHNGTYVSDLQNATRWYLELKGLNDTFYERTWYCNFTFADVEYEVEQCQDVLLLLGFYELQSGGWVRLGGHYVTISGVNASGEIKFSDPTLDNAEAGGRGQVLPLMHPPHPGDPTVHNNASYVSHDYYTVAPSSPVPGTHWGIEDYPAYDVFYDVNGCNESDYYEGGLLFTAVEYAVVICPLLHGPIANFTESTHTADVNEVIDFNASGSLPGFNGVASVPIANYTWDFGDGNTTTVTGPTITHYYTTNGNYTVTLTVTTQDDPILIANGLTKDSVSANKTINPAVLVHDVAVIDEEVFVNPSKYPSRNVSGAYESYPTWGVSYKVNVIVKNEGNYIESFTVTLLLQNSTGNYTKGTQPVNNLAAGANTTLTFSFAVPPLPGYPSNRRAAWPYPNYTVWANASILPGETDTADNQLFNGLIKVKWPGDADGNGYVRLPDLTMLAKAWYGDLGGTAAERAKYNYKCDFDMNGEVKLPDLVTLAKNWYKGPRD